MARVSEENLSPGWSSCQKQCQCWWWSGCVQVFFGQGFYVELKLKEVAKYSDSCTKVSWLDEYMAASFYTWDGDLPALFMGLTPFSAKKRFPPNGMYCWLRGKLSVFNSCRRCLSLKTECTVFRKSLLLSEELEQKIKGVNTCFFLYWCQSWY